MASLRISAEKWAQQNNPKASEEWVRGESSSLCPLYYYEWWLSEEPFLKFTYRRPIEWRTLFSWDFEYLHTQKIAIFSPGSYVLIRLLKKEKRICITRRGVIEYGCLYNARVQQDRGGGGGSSLIFKILSIFIIFFMIKKIFQVSLNS